MKNELKIALVQCDLAWENPEKNRNNISHKLQELTETFDIAVLPEMFTSGFTMNTKKVAETMQGNTIAWMKALAIKHNAAIVGSIPIVENYKVYNRLLFVEPLGTIKTYDKKHTFSLAGEDKVYTSGNKKLLINYKGWKLCPLICYDLRFPVWSRNSENYDVLFYIASWPKSRITAWNTLLKARAIENLSYCVGVNRVGTDGLNIEYSGNSAVYDVLGNTVTSLKPDKEQIDIIALKKTHITHNRNKFKFLDDRDNFTVL